MGVAGGDRGQPLVDRARRAVQHARAERLALEIPERDVDRRDGVGGDAAAVAVPPGLILVLARHIASVCDRVPADQTFGAMPSMIALVGEVGLRELGDRLAPADLPVVGRDLAQAQMAQRIEVVGLGVADRDRLDLRGSSSSHPLADRAAKQRHALDADIDPSSRPFIAATAVSNGPMSQQYSTPPRPNTQLRIVPPVSRKSMRRSVAGDHVDAAGGHRGDPEIAVPIDLEAVRDVSVRHRVDRSSCAPSGRRRTTFRV